MPKAAEKKIKARGGAKRWRMKRVDGKLLRCAVTKKAGPEGGQTVCYPVKKKAASKSKSRKKR